MITKLTKQHDIEILEDQDFEEIFALEKLNNQQKQVCEEKIKEEFIE